MRTRTLIFRWSIVTGGLIALFWAIWYWNAGSVPTITSIKMTEAWTMSLPFGISRWWDILIGPVWSIIIIYLITKLKDKDDDLVFSLVVSLVFGLVVSLVVSLVFGLVVSLVFGLAAGLVFGLAAGLVFGLAAGLVFGLVFGLAAGLVFGLVFGLGVSLAALIKLIASQSFWTKIGNWLMAK